MLKFYGKLTAIFRISNKINDFKEIQNDASKTGFQDSAYFSIKDVIVTSSSLLLITTNLFSHMLMVRDSGYTYNCEKKIESISL